MGVGWFPEPEETLMMAPRRWLMRKGTTARVVRTVPSTFTCRIP